MKMLLKDLVEKLAASAYSEIGDSGHHVQEMHSASAPMQEACQVPASA